MTTQRHGAIPEWTLGDRLRKARSLTGLNTSDFANLIGVSQKSVNNAEGDKHEVRKIVLNAWAMATGVSVEWLEKGNGITGPTPPDDGETGDQLARLTAAKRARAGNATGHADTARELVAA